MLTENKTILLFSFLLSFFQGSIATFDYGFIRQHEVPTELKMILDAHVSELELIPAVCARKYHCVEGVRMYPWLADYVIKHQLLRLRGAIKIQKAINGLHLDCLIIPKKYAYHLAGHPVAINNSNYLVVATKIRTREPRRLTREEVRQLCIFITSTGYYDVHLGNILLSDNNKIAIIDTENHNFRKNKIEETLMRLLTVSWGVGKDYGLEDDAYELVFAALRERELKRPGKAALNQSKLLHLIKSTPQPLQTLYMGLYEKYFKQASQA